MRISALASISLLGLVVSACASVTPDQVSGPDGRPAYSMKCSGFGRTVEDCYAKAGEICPAGYTVFDNRSAPGPLIAAGSLLIPTSRDSMLIGCK